MELEPSARGGKIAKEKSNLTKGRSPSSLGQQGRALGVWKGFERSRAPIFRG